MRLIAVLAAAALLAAADDPPPPPTQKIVDGSVENVRKSYDAYLAALHKEQDKLVAALQKEQDKATKKGDLEGALAIKAQIDDVQSGLLQREAETARDLLGNPSTGGGAQVPAVLATDLSVAVDSTPVANPPKELEAILRRSSHLVLPKGNATRWNFTVTAGGMVLVATGSGARNHAEIWQDLQKAGFHRLDDASVREVWWVLVARQGMHFTLADPPAPAPTAVFANRFLGQK